jgi:hypothetical protein
MVTWFDQDTGGLLEVLRGAATERFTGALAVAGRGGGGHVWCRDGLVVAARTDEQPTLSAALVATGTADGTTVAELGRAGARALEHPAMTPAVAAVAEELGLEAIARLVALPEGSVRGMPEDQPSLPLLSLTVQELVAGLEARRARRQVQELGRRGHWTATGAGGGGGGVQLDASQWQLVVAMTRSSSASDLAARTGRDFGEVNGALRRLEEAGHVRRETGAAAPPPPAAPAANPRPSQAAGLRGAAPRRTTTSPPPATPSSGAVPSSGAGAPGAVPAGAVPTTVGGGPEAAPNRANALRRLIGAVRAG